MGSKLKKKAELEREELRAALEEAEGALELEESRVLRLQLEMTQVKSDIDRKLQEKDEEFDSTRKNYARSVESMQASLDIEIKARSDSVRAKKKFEMQLEHANRNLTEQVKLSKTLQVTIKEMQDFIDDEARNHEEIREQFSIQERKLTIVMSELDETRNALEANERARKQAENELLEVTDRVNILSAQNSALS